jgi:hypothetical protein
MRRCKTHARHPRIEVAVQLDPCHVTVTTRRALPLPQRFLARLILLPSLRSTVSMCIHHIKHAKKYLSGWGSNPAFRVMRWKRRFKPRRRRGLDPRFRLCLAEGQGGARLTMFPERVTRGSSYCISRARSARLFVE